MSLAVLAPFYCSRCWRNPCACGIEGPSSILDRWARSEIGRDEAERLLAQYRSVHPLPKQKTIECVGCGTEMNDYGQFDNDPEAARCGKC